jgi:hypothetical protein
MQIVGIPVYFNLLYLQLGMRKSNGTHFRFGLPYVWAPEEYQFKMSYPN